MSWSTRSRPAKSRSALRTSRGTAMELSLFFWGCETKYKLGTCNPIIKKKEKINIKKINIKKKYKKKIKKKQEKTFREREREQKTKEQKEMLVYIR